MRRVLLGLCAISLVLPVLEAGAPPPAAGTESEPEVSDAAGNVVYSPLYAGSRDREHIDALAGWFSFHEETDAISFTMKVSSLVDVTARTAGYEVVYLLDTTVSLGDEEVGIIHFENHKGPSSETWTQHVSFARNSAPGTAERTELPSTFSAITESPGYMRWMLPAESLRKIGDTAGDFRLVALEDQYVAGGDMGIINMNEARATTTYEFGSPEPSTAKVPEKTEQRTRWPERNPDTTPVNGTSGFPAIFAVGALLVVVVTRRR